MNNSQHLIFMPAITVIYGGTSTPIPGGYATVYKNGTVLRELLLDAGQQSCSIGQGLLCELQIVSSSGAKNEVRMKASSASIGLLGGMEGGAANYS